MLYGKHNIALRIRGRHINEMTLPLNNPDFAKVVLTKNNVCVFTLQKSLFCVAKQALLLCKTMGFGTY